MFSETSSNTESNISILSPSSVIESTSSSKSQPGPKKRPVWQHFDSIGLKDSGHQGCKCKYCNWSQKKGKPSLMEAHLALNCYKVPKEIKNIYLHFISNRDDMKSDKQQSKKQKLVSDNGKKISDFYRPATIDFETVKLANRALVKFFICCGIPFSAASHPFFRDFVQILHPGYIPPYRTELSQELLDGELARVLLNIEKELEHEDDLTLSKFINNL
jgi:hypothetical protein